MNGRYLVTITEGWDKDLDKANWCVEAFSEDEEVSYGYAYSTNGYTDAVYDVFKAIEMGRN